MEGVGGPPDGLTVLVPPGACGVITAAAAPPGGGGAGELSGSDLLKGVDEAAIEIRKVFEKLKNWSMC